jgi:hypothetical protein
MRIAILAAVACRDRTAKLTDVVARLAPRGNGRPRLVAMSSVIPST